MPDRLSIHVLLENSVARPGCQSEHGLSVLVETPDSTILWDTGQSAMFMDNALAMDLDLARVDMIALSHGHYDHTNGLMPYLERFSGRTVHAHPGVFDARYTSPYEKGDPPRSIGINSTREEYEAAGAVFSLDSGVVELAPGVRLTGQIPRKTDYEDTGGDFYLDKALSQPDPLADDISMFIETPKGLVVLLGCAHSGVVNILDHVSEITGASNIYALIGGMHLIRADRARLEATAAVFERYDIKLLGPCHCTGDTAVSFFDERFPERMIEVGAGMVLDI